MKFGYKKYGQVLRPVIPISLEYKDKRIRYEVLVDSGADICLFHAEVAEALGIDLKKCKPNIVTGVGGKSSQYFLSNLDMEVGGWKYKIEAGFLPDIGGRSAPYGIVGQKGFFEFFKIVFDRTGEDIEIKVKQK